MSYVAQRVERHHHVCTTRSRSGSCLKMKSEFFYVIAIILTLQPCWFLGPQIHIITCLRFAVLSPGGGTLTGRPAGTYAMTTVCSALDRYLDGIPLIAIILTGCHGRTLGVWFPGQTPIQLNGGCSCGACCWSNIQASICCNGAWCDALYC